MLGWIAVRSNFISNRMGAWPAGATFCSAITDFRGVGERHVGQPHRQHSIRRKGDSLAIGDFA